MKSQYILNLAGLIACLDISVHADVTNGLIAHFPLDETSGLTAFDTSGENRDATLVNFSANGSQWIKGRVDGGLEFNAANKHRVVIDDTADELNFSKAVKPAFTLALWIKGKSAQTGAPGIVAKGHGQGGEQYAIDIWHGKLRFFVRDVSGENAFAVESGIALNDTWQHVTAVFDSTAPETNRLKFYLDGRLIKSGPGPDTLQDIASEVSLGCRKSDRDSGYDLPLDGVLDDVRFYNRALTDNDVQELAAMQSERPAFLKSFSPIGKNAAPDATVQIVLRDFVSKLNAKSVRLLLDQVEVTPVVTTNSDGIAVMQYQPPKLLDPGSAHQVHISFGEGGTLLGTNGFSYGFSVNSNILISR